MQPIVLFVHGLMLNTLKKGRTEFRIFMCFPQHEDVREYPVLGKTWESP